MNAPISPPPVSPLRAEAENGDLQARILQAEQRLIARQERMHRRLAAVGLRVQRAIQPRRLLLPLGATLGLGVLGWIWRGRRAAPAPAWGAYGARAGTASADHGGLPWLRLVGVLWPLLPAAWRNRVSPATVNLALSVGLPLTQALLHPRRPPPLADAGPVAPARLAGGWHELAWLPPPAARAGGTARRWQHTLLGDGSIDLHATRLQADGSVRQTRARAQPVAGAAGARWRVRGGRGLLRAWPWAGHEMAVLHIDDAAGTLLLGSPGRDRLRLLSRGPGLAPEQLQALRAVADQRGYDVERLQYADAP